MFRTYSSFRTSHPFTRCAIGSRIIGGGPFKMLRHVFHPSCITLFLPFISSFSFLFFLTFSLSLILVLSYALMSAHLSRMSTLRDLFEIVVSNYDISTRYLYTYTGWLDRLFWRPRFCFSFVFFHSSIRGVGERVALKGNRTTVACSKLSLPSSCEITSRLDDFRRVAESAVRVVRAHGSYGGAFYR